MHSYIHLNNYSNGKEKWSYHPNILNIWISCLLGKQEGSNLFMEISPMQRSGVNHRGTSC